MMVTIEARLRSLNRIYWPPSQPMHAQIVLLVFQELVQAGTIDIGELDLHFLRSDPIDISFYDVLLT